MQSCRLHSGSITADLVTDGTTTVAHVSEHSSGPDTAVLTPGQRLTLRTTGDPTFLWLTDGFVLGTGQDGAGFEIPVIDTASRSWTQLDVGLPASAPQYARVSPASGNDDWIIVTNAGTGVSHNAAVLASSLTRLTGC